VLVVGAGPTGLLLAAELARRNVPCLLIDASGAPLGWDRATVVHARSMEIFEALGLAHHFLDRGVRTRAARFRSGGEVLGELNFAAADGRYSFDIGISEEVTESVLTGYLEAHGGAVTRSTRLVGLLPLPDGVVATLERHGEQQEIRVSWVVGCDGLRSTVRELAGIELPGTEAQAPWAVFDATLEGWNQEYDMVFPHLDVPPVILTPLPGRRWRVYLRPTTDRSDLAADAIGVLRRYAPHVAFADVENPARFRCHSRVAERFRDGRVLLAGDAAHVCSPAEGHGMNTGLQDAFNLGWKLALVAQGVSAPRLLESYEAERRPVALRVVESGEDVEVGQAMTAQVDRAARDDVIRTTFADPGTAHHEAVAAAELDRSYADSAVVRGDASDRLAPGARLPLTDPVEPAVGERSALHELTHRRGHTLLVLGGPEAAAADVAELAAALEVAHASSPLVSAVIGLATRADDPRIGRMDESVAEQLGVRGVTALAVRPDRYVGLRHDGTNPGAIADYLDVVTA
jgi:2-polyprenyl-6-methoxyphenol hydroxylase-like FAD-dependent oxidoreductase